VLTVFSYLYYALTYKFASNLKGEANKYFNALVITITSIK